MTDNQPTTNFSKTWVLEKLDAYIASVDDADLQYMECEEGSLSLNDIRNHIAEGTDFGREQSAVWGRIFSEQE